MAPPVPVLVLVLLTTLAWKFEGIWGNMSALFKFLTFSTGCWVLGTGYWVLGGDCYLLWHNWLVGIVIKSSTRVQLD